MQATTRAVFQDIGCSACTAKAMMEAQGIDTLDKLCFLKYGDVETLCKNVKCQGGAAGGNNRSANLGHLVSQEAESIRIFIEVQNPCALVLM